MPGSARIEAREWPSLFLCDPTLWATAGKISYGSQASSELENCPGFGNCLLRLGIHISSDSRWRARSSAVPPRRPAIPRGGIGSLRVDAGTRGALTGRAPLALGTLA